MNVQPVTLIGDHVRLEPLALSHAGGLLAAGGDPSIWTHFIRPMPRELAEIRSWIEEALAGQAHGARLPFAIIARPIEQVAGSTSYLNISPPDRSLEIGWTWLGTAWQRTATNSECKLLLLRHAFETLGAVRVQLKTDLRNERSQRAIERLGAVREGVLRKYQVTQGGRHRDTVMYSILDDEWPRVRAGLEARLAPQA